MKKLHNVILSVGSNIDAEVNIPFSFKQINEHVGEVVKRSRLYYTEPWGYESQKAFMNYCCLVKTFLDPLELLHELKKIEKNSGRNPQKNGIYHDRELDIDILFYDDIIYLSKNLIIPHPFIHLRNFVLHPLCDIAPDFVHPIFKKSIRELLSMCPDKHFVRRAKLILS